MSHLLYTVEQKLLGKWVWRARVSNRTEAKKILNAERSRDSHLSPKSFRIRVYQSIGVLK